MYMSAEFLEHAAKRFTGIDRRLTQNEWFALAATVIKETYRELEEPSLFTNEESKVIREFLQRMVTSMCNRANVTMLKAEGLDKNGEDVLFYPTYVNEKTDPGSWTII
jgi:hypothetical protein